MPNEGWRTLSIRKFEYEALTKIYKDNQKMFYEEGVTSFAGFIMLLLHDAMKIRGIKY